MHAPTVLSALLAGLAAALPQSDIGPGTGSRCCNGGTSETSKFCIALGLNAFCCSGINASTGTGCDKVPQFPTGRDVQNVVPTSQTCESDKLAGFIACA
ncbi:hypothetical protein LX36DRAFT_660314 [Colletotrichum falcatum]|nr:hypothetical protein LX36DRAFT_660314 [Colletotrichum falcatum]